MEPLALHAAHVAAGARLGTLEGREVVEAFASPEAEEAAVRSGAALLDASHRDLLSVTGPDGPRFLQGMLSADVQGVADGQALWAALLTHKGTLVSDAEVVRFGDRTLLDLEPGRGPAVRAALEKLLIADDAELADARESWARLELWGPGAEALSERAGVRSARANLGALSGRYLYLPRAELAAAWRTLREGGAVPAGFERREAWRLEAGLPRFGAEGEEGGLPLELGMSGAISYSKGCYLGQEGVARATYRGQLHWGLARLSLGDAPLPPGTELHLGESNVGRLTSVA